MTVRAGAIAMVVGCAFLLTTGAEAGSALKSEGLASWYKMGTQTANGERYDPMGITAAHPSLPFDTRVRVTNPDNGKSVVVRINDRGPFTGNRIIDLSKGAAKVLRMRQDGVVKVRIEVVGTPQEADVAALPQPKPVAAGDATEPDAASAAAEAVTEQPPLRLMAEQRINVLSR